MLTSVMPTEGVWIKGPPQGQWTYADWEQIEYDGNRYEVIDGYLYMTTSPSNHHQWIISRLHKYFGLPAEDRGLGYAYFAPIGVLMPGCDPVQPDLLFIRSENVGIIADRCIRGVPDILIEIVSPGSQTYDEHVKLRAYENAGVPEFAIIYPASRSVHVYRLNTDHRYDPPVQLSDRDPLAFVCLPGIVVSVSALFDGSPDDTI